MVMNGEPKARTWGLYFAPSLEVFCLEALSKATETVSQDRHSKQATSEHLASCLKPGAPNSNCNQTDNFEISGRPHLIFKQ